MSTMQCASWPGLSSMASRLQLKKPAAFMQGLHFQSETYWKLKRHSWMRRPCMEGKLKEGADDLVVN